MTDPQPNELEWLAFRYVAGEMAPDEIAAFDERLAQEQAAREAVADAVELIQSVRLALGADEVRQSATASPSPHSAQRAAWLRPVAWLTVGAAAALLVAAGWQLLRSGRAGDQGQVQMVHSRAIPQNAAAAELARLWMETRDELAAQSGEEPWALDLAEVPVEDLLATVDVTNEDLLEGDAAGAAPSWMQAAVVGALGASPPALDKSKLPQ